MKSERTEWRHVGLFREFVDTVCRTYGQSNTTIIFSYTLNMFGIEFAVLQLHYTNFAVFIASNFVANALVDELVKLLF